MKTFGPAKSSIDILAETRGVILRSRHIADNGGYPAGEGGGDKASFSLFESVDVRYARAIIFAMSASALSIEFEFPGIV